MNKLLTIAVLLIGMIGTAQVEGTIWADTTEWVNMSNAKSPILTINEDGTEVTIGWDDAHLVTIELFLQYENDCWNDSTYLKGAIYKRLNGITFVDVRPEPYETMINYIKDTVLYTHREPTFKGFLKWIKNR